MKHDRDCQCPIHIIEDTRRVKLVAGLVLIFFLGLFLFTL